MIFTSPLSYPCKLLRHVSTGRRSIVHRPEEPPSSELYRGFRSPSAAAILRRWIRRALPLRRRNHEPTSFSVNEDPPLFGFQGFPAATRKCDALWNILSSRILFSVPKLWLLTMAAPLCEEPRSPLLLLDPFLRTFVLMRTWDSDCTAHLSTERWTFTIVCPEYCEFINSNGNSFALLRGLNRSRSLLMMVFLANTFIYEFKFPWRYFYVYIFVEAFQRRFLTFQSISMYDGSIGFYKRWSTNSTSRFLIVLAV